MTRVMVGIGGAAAIVVVLALFHATLFQAFTALDPGNPDPAALAWRVQVGLFIEMAGVVGIVVLGVWSRNRPVAVAYALAGAFLAFRWPVWVSFRRQGDWSLLTWPDQAGPVLMNAGFALLATGLLVFILVRRERLASRRPVPSESAPSEPVEPAGAPTPTA